MNVTPELLAQALYAEEDESETVPWSALDEGVKAQVLAYAETVLATCQAVARASKPKIGSTMCELGRPLRHHTSKCQAGCDWTPETFNQAVPLTNKEIPDGPEPELEPAPVAHPDLPARPQLRLPGRDRGRPTGNGRGRLLPTQPGLPRPPR